jgi:hypothetical protein
MPGIKFSQFAPGGPTTPGDEVVGLRNGINTLFDAPIAGEATFFAKPIVQAAHGFVVGNVLRLNGAVYVLAQADNAGDADVIGIVTGVIDVNTFTLQFGGYVTGLVGLVAGSPYFLSAAVAGAMTAVPPAVPGQVLKSLLIADSATTGYWLNYIGQVL